MNTYTSFTSYLLRMFTLLLFVFASGCDRDTAASTGTKNFALSGTYILSGEREVSSEIVLKPNGEFVYRMIYGAVDEGAVGKWRSTDSQVILDVDKRKQGQAAPPPTDKIELQINAGNLVWNRNDNALVYIKAVTDETPTHYVKDGLPRTKPIELDIVGYNYTDKYIESFSVNGYAGGDVSVSSFTAGGGSAMCCFPFFSKVTFPYEVDVEWGSTDRDGPTQKKKILIPKPRVSNPKMLEIHFYQDGRIEGEFTEWYSEPRLKLDRKNRYQR